jgi:hypothetical protein
MKYFRLIILLAILLPNLTFAISITKTLRVGSSGPEVLELQRILNKDKQTEVASFGPGSLGNETSFFGIATKQAVIKFQEKYKDEVLIPAGLLRGTGVVGALTRNKLASLDFVSNILPLPKINEKNPKNSNILATSSTPSDVSVDFSNVQFDQNSFLSAIEKVGTAKGLSKEKLANLKTEVEKNINTNHSEKLFLSRVQKSGVKIHVSSNATSNKKPNGLMTFFEGVMDFFKPEKAYAFGTPFGGRVLFTFLCTCSGNWLVTLMPTGPTYATLLTYYEGTQAYMGYNLPFTLNVLGEYTQGSVCEFYVGTACGEIPSEGMIGPITGSSPL